MQDVDQVYVATNAILNNNGKDVNISIDEKAINPNDQSSQTKLYKRRYLILLIFCLYSMSSAFQWIEYAIIMNIIIRYYGTTDLAVTWTSMIYMLSYIPLVFVATWMLDNWGLRRILMLGASLNAIGALIKIGSVAPHLFALSFVGQTIAACAQSFILEIPPKIASLWFGPSEVSTATSIGVFGNQLGVALGFFLPPIIVPDSEDLDEIAMGLRILFISSGVICSIVAVLIFIVIRDEPALPPSKARALASQAETKTQDFFSSFKSYGRSIHVLLKNVPYVLLLISYGINTGTYYAIGTLLNPILLEYHEHALRQIGEIGLTMVVAGLFGSVVCGIFLDRTKKYKITTVIIYVLSLAFMVVFTFTLQLDLWVDYIVIGLLGFFMTGYLPIGFEFAAEITYPESEATSSGLLNVSAQVFGILFILVAQELLNHFKALSANIFMFAALIVGTVMTALIKENLKRQKAEKSEETVKCEDEQEKMVFTSKHNENQNNKLGNKECAEEDEKLIRLASASSYYSAG